MLDKQKFIVKNFEKNIDMKIRNSIECICSDIFIIIL